MEESISAGRIILFVIISAITALIFVPLKPQITDYQHFADSRTIYGIKNFYNILFSIPMFIMGIMGLFNLSTPEKTAKLII